jgi:hypothetical protein
VFLFSGAGGAFAQAPQLTKQFGATTIPVHGSTSLTFTVVNTNLLVTLTGIGFTDTLPAGLVISTPNGLVNTCGGTVAATSGSNNIDLSGGSAPASFTCFLIVDVTATGIGTITNTTSAIISNGGTGTPAHPLDGAKVSAKSSAQARRRIPVRCAGRATAYRPGNTRVSSVTGYVASVLIPVRSAPVRCAEPRPRRSIVALAICAPPNYCLAIPRSRARCAISALRLTTL